MSITSVGASFGYIDPATVAGPAPSAPQSSDDDGPSPASASSKPDDGSSDGNPVPVPPPQTTSSDGPKFAPETAAALVQVQEKAAA